MTLNYPGPYEIRIFYTTSVSSVPLTHIQHLSLDIVGAVTPGQAFSSILPKTRAFPGGSLTLQALVDLWVTSFRSLLSSGAGNTIDRAELWQYEEGTFDATFISAYTIGLAGLSGGAFVGSGQSIVTMRTQQGGIFKLSFMEVTISSGPSDFGTISNANLETLVLAIEAGDYPWLGRDGSYPFVRIGHYPGINEALFKIRNR